MMMTFSTRLFQFIEGEMFEFLSPAYESEWGFVI